jgi:FkbM family methyltransferase
MKNLMELKKKYSLGKIKKATYIRQMYDIHSMLFEYAQFIKDTDVAEINLSDNSVIMTSRFSGARFYCVPNDRRVAPIEALNFGGYETEEFSIFLKLLQKDSVVFDIGANIGWYSVTIGKLCPQLQIYAFEPIKKTYEYLKKNITLNKPVNIKPYNFGFSDRKQRLTFYYYPEGSGNASSVNLTKADHAIKLQCDVKTIDDFVQKLQCRVDVIKCDVEGAELLVFQGGLKVLNRDKPVVFSEILRKWSAKFKYDPNEIITLFNNTGYQCFSIKNKVLKRFNAMDENTQESNFFFLHTIKHEKIINQLVK